MGRSLFEELPTARALFQQADDILGYSLSSICFNGPKEVLDATEHSQPALFVCSLAALEHLNQTSPETVENCAAAAGLSLGEYTAIVFSGGLDFADGLRLVRQRGLAMQAAADLVPSGMVSILGLPTEQVQALCNQAREENEILQIANMLCPGNIVISGHKLSCANAAEQAPALGAMRAVPLAVAGAFHTELMRPAVSRLAEGLAQCDIKTPRVPVISNVDAQAHSDPAQIRQILEQQVCSPVLWEASMRKLIAEGCDQLFEIGTGNVLRGLLKRIDRKLNCQAVP